MTKNKIKRAAEWKRWYLKNKAYAIVRNYKYVHVRKKYCRTHKKKISKYATGYRLSKSGFTSNLWSRLNRRTVNGSNPNLRLDSCEYLYYIARGIRLEFTRQELENFVEANWATILKIRSQKQRVSIDRIDSDKHYSLDNIRFISTNENSSRVAARRKSLHSAL
jgi:hypothetical protein